MLNKLPSYEKLTQLSKNHLHLKDLLEDTDRLEKFSIKLENLHFDFSKQRIDSSILSNLIELANEANVPEKIIDLFQGSQVNITEGQAALHYKYRDVDSEFGQNYIQELEQFYTKISALKPKNILLLGIGGSELGPRLLLDSLGEYKINDYNFVFLANTDGHTLANALKDLNPSETVCLVSSKSFTTLETLAIFKLIKNWYKDDALLFTNSMAITVKADKAVAYGFLKSNIFSFAKEVGGRYSIWSPIGLPCLLAFGLANFKSFLRGAHCIDKHVQDAPLEQNIPAILALVGIWNINFLNMHSLLVMPYLDRLSLLPSYLQQLEMESNGKVATSQGLADYHTAPVVFGGTGCNGQHSYMQLCHMGSQVIPIDFLLQSKGHDQTLQDIQIASCIGQASALAIGQNSNDDSMQFFGNRPSNLFIFDELTPSTLGMLMSIYEHKVFIQGVVWDLQTFDQNGVELGKKLIKKVY